MISDTRRAERLERAKTLRQKETMERLFEEGKDAYPESRQGKTVVEEFRRYVDTRDPEKIGNGLYHFSTMGAGGLNDIAHFNIHGFRSVYPHPAVYIERLLICEIERWSPERLAEDPNAYHSLYVYTDGMTSGEVAARIIEIAYTNRREVLADWKERRYAEDLAEATRLAARIGMRLVEKEGA
jgi:hypothetical protein